MTLKNTDKEYIITVTNRQTIDGVTDTITETAEGSLSEKNGKQYILYKSENDGDVTSVMIRIQKDMISIKRSGSIETIMEYKIGAARKMFYRLPYGTIEMEIKTERIMSDINEEGGRIELVYTISAQGEQYFNDMTITIDKR